QDRNWENTIRARQIMDQETAQRSNIAYQTAQTNRLNQLTPLEAQEQKINLQNLQGLQAMANDPQAISVFVNGATQGLGPLTPNEQARLDAAKTGLEGGLRKGKFNISGVQSAMQDITQDRKKKRGEPLGDRVPLLNQALSARFQMLNPGLQLPPFLALSPNAT